MAWRGFFSRLPVRGVGAAAPGSPGRGTVGAPGSGPVGAPAHGPVETLRSAPGRWTAALLLGGLWWWAVLRLLFWPEGAGVVEGAMVAGGWGLSLLPVHCVPRQARRGGGRAGVIGWRRRGGCAGRPYGPALPDRITDGFTKAYTKAYTKVRRYRRGGPGRL